MTLKILREFDFYSSYIQTFASLEKLILEGNNPLQPSTALFEKSLIPFDEVDFSDPSGLTLKDKSVFSTQSLELSEEGLELSSKQATFDYFYDLLKLDLHRSIYIGFKTDNILNIYPGKILMNTDFDLTVREWYYRAEGEYGLPTMTEPYKDYFNLEWMLTVSQSLMKNNETYAVVGVDISLSTFSKAVFDSDFMGNGFIVYLTNDGVILYSAPILSKFITTNPAKYTDIGISDNLWVLIQNSIEGSEFIYSFEDPSGKVFKFSRVIGKSSLYTDRNFYILACLPMDISVDFVYGLFELSTDYVFLFLLGILIFITLFFGVFYKRIVTKNDDVIENINQIVKSNIKRVYLNRERTAELDQQLLMAEDNGLQGLFVQKIMQSCSQLMPLSSANDKILYSSWENDIFPKAKPQRMPWKKVLSELEDYKILNFELAYV